MVGGSNFLRESRKVPQLLSNSLVEGVDNLPAGNLSVFLMFWSVQIGGRGQKGVGNTRRSGTVGKRTGNLFRHA